MEVRKREGTIQRTHSFVLIETLVVGKLHLAQIFESADVLQRLGKLFVHDSVQENFFVEKLSRVRDACREREGRKEEYLAKLVSNNGLLESLLRKRTSEPTQSILSCGIEL